MRSIMAGMLVVAVGVSGASRAAEEVAPPAVGATLDVPVLSAYVWRGQVLNDEPVVQPSLTVTKGGLSLNTWGSFNLTDAVTEDAAAFSEIDLTVSYSKTVGPVSLGVGVIDYLFPNTAFAGTREVYVTASLPSLIVVPTLGVYYDFDEADGAYANLGLAYSRGFGELVTLSLTASVGAATDDYNSFYYGVSDTAFNDVNGAAALTFKALDNLTITPAIQYTALLDSTIEDGAAGLYQDDDQLVGSLKASYTF